MVIKGCSLIATDNLIITDNPCIYIAATSVCAGILHTEKGEKMAYTVYKHTSPSGKVYIGVTSLRPKERWSGGAGYVKNKHFYRAIKKYGWENIKH